MAIELIATETTTQRGSGRQTVQTADPRSSSRNRSVTPGDAVTTQTQTQTADSFTTSRTSSKEADPTSVVTTDDATLTLSFTVRFANETPVPPPGEATPSPC